MKNWLRGALAAVLAGSLAPAAAQVADSTTATLQLLIMGQGLHNNDWGAQTNTNLQKIESAIAAASPLIVSGGSMTLTDDQARPAVLSFTGTLVADEIVTVPARSKSWIVLNKTSGAFALKLKTASGTPTTVPQSASQARLFYSDGVNVFDVSAGGVPDLTSNTVLANLGAGPVAATMAQLQTALGIDAASTPTFASMNLAAAAGNIRSVVFRTTTAAGPPPVYSTRWIVGADSTAESGSNAGSDFQVCARADDGTTTTGCWLEVTRATGALTATGGPWTINGPVTITNGPLTISSGSLIVGGATIGNPTEGFFKNLKITVTSDTAATVSADALTLWDGSTGTKTFRSLSGSVSTACSTGVLCMDTGGPGTSRWLQVWAIGKPDGTISATFTAAAAPTPPALATGYTYYARLGAVRIDASARIVKTIQRGAVARYVVQGSGSTPTLPVLASGTAGAPATPTWVTVAWSGVAPPTAASLQIIAASSGGSIMAAPNSNYGGNASTSNPAFCQAAVSGAFVRSFCDIPLETSNISWASDVASQSLLTVGWTDLL